MSTSTFPTHADGATSQADWVRRLAPGLVAGFVFAMWAMVVGIFTSTLWAAPQGIAQAIGIGSPGHDFQIVASVVGLMGHMMNSVILGVIFTAVAVGVLRLRGWGLLLAGMMYGVVLYAIMYDLVLRGILASTSASFLSANPEWSWIAGHLMYGVALAWLLAYGPLSRARQGG
jgi:hypothetical protein